ncbi:MAG: indole-3-glycerol phosphate synthase TrpC [Candidatus Omnitrophica bacterium]|nr:indole-3-glycerol phosphate synthase TrpC [Candidatus Omnitrophota bacterium]
MHKTLSLILEAKKKNVEVLKKSMKELISFTKDVSKPVSLAKVLREEEGLSFIAEIKQASPSAGILRQDFNCLEVLKEYLQAGVSAISVVTEEEFFLGKLKYLKEVKEKTKLPVLRKDFIIDETQVYQSRALGADVILLIANILKPEKLKKLYDLAKELGMDVVVEVHTLKELKEVLKFSPEIIGINNRDLNTFEVNLETTFQLTPLIPEDIIVISESGINELKDILLLKGAGVEGVLVGEALMKAPDIKEKIKELKVGCKD